MNYFVAPVSASASYKNYQRTVVNGLEPSEYKMLNNVSDVTDAKLYLWAAKRNNIWAKISVGDYIMFYKSYTLISYSKVVGKMQSLQNAEKLWGDSEYSYIFLLSPTYDINIPFKIINEMSGYSPEYICQSFSQLNNKFKDELEKRYKLFLNFVTADFQKNN